MSNNSHKTPLADRFNTFGSVPSEAVWDAIDSRLSAQGSKNKGFIFWLVANAAVIGLLIYSAGTRLAPIKIEANTPVLSSEDPTQNTPKNLEQSSDTHEMQLLNEVEGPTSESRLLETPRQSSYLNQSRAVSWNEAKAPKKQLIDLGQEQKNNAIASFIQPEAVASLQPQKATAIPHVIHHDPITSAHSTMKQRKWLEIGVRASLFSTLPVREKTVGIAADGNIQPSSSIPAVNASTYAYQEQHDRLFDFEIFARAHYHNTYGTLGFNTQKTLVKEIRGDSDFAYREFISKEITSIGTPVALGYNVISRSRFQFAFALRVIPTYSFLTAYEKTFDQQSFTSTQNPPPLYSFQAIEEADRAFTLDIEPHLSANFILNERIDLFGQFGYRTGIVRSSIFSRYFAPNFTSISVGTVFRL